MTFALRPYQKTGVEFLKARRFALLGDAPGVGKTCQAIMALDPSWSVLIVCPASVKLQWQAALKDWRNWGSTIIDSGDFKFLLSSNAFTLIVNYDLLVRDELLRRLLTIDWDCVVLDEAHRVKSMTSKRTKACLGRAGLRSRAKRMWFLTGTPVKNRPVDLYPVLRSCAPEVITPYDTYLKFVYRYCGAYKGQFGLDTSGASHMEELGDRLKTFMLRREKRDVLTELPPRIISKVEIPCSTAAREIIEDEMQETIDQAGDRDPSLFKLGEQVRIRKALAKYKVEGAAVYIKDLLETENKIVVFYHHKEVLNGLKENLKTFGSVYIDGSVHPAKRGDIVRGFNQDKNIRIFFGQMEACGEGIDGLQHGSSCCVFVEPSWSHTDIEQCIGRLERSGQRSEVNTHILVIKDTIESRMMDVVAMKLSTDKRLYEANKTQNKEGNMSKKTVSDKEFALILALRDLMGETPTPAPEPEAQDAEPVDEAVEVEVEQDKDVTEDALRSRCADICTVAPGGKGKDAVVALIRKIGGGKIADLKTPEQRVQAMTELDALYSKLAGK